MEAKPISIKQCCFQAIKREGPMSLYKGLTQPLLGATPVNSM